MILVRDKTLSRGKNRSVFFEMLGILVSLRPQSLKNLPSVEASERSFE